MIIEPIFEANFLECSYGFRPKHNQHQAVRAVQKALVHGWYVVDADIQRYFDNINHEILMKLVAKRISDRRVLKLIRQWLKAEVVENGQKISTEKGSPQGEVISSLLANIYLHVLDMYWTRECKQLGALFRYCDDFVIICKTNKDAQKAKKNIESFLKCLRLKLHPIKTKVVYTRYEGFDFLGFHFHKKKALKTKKLVPYIWPSPKALNGVRSRIRQITDRKHLRKTMTEIIEELNPVIRGWRNYFSVGNSSKKFCQLDGYIEKRLLISAKARKGSRRYLDKNTFYFWYKNCGVENFYLPGICGN